MNTITVSYNISRTFFWCNYELFF